MQHPLTTLIESPQSDPCPQLPEFLEKKRPDRLVKCVLHLADLAKKHGIDRSAASSVLADAAKLDEADAKKAAEADAKEAARIKEVRSFRALIQRGVSAGRSLDRSG